MQCKYTCSGNPGLHQATPKTCCECYQLIDNNSTLQCDNQHLDVHVNINNVALERFAMLDIPFICPKCECNEIEVPFLDNSMSLGDDMILDSNTIVDVTMEIIRPDGKGLLTACLNANSRDVQGRMGELRLQKQVYWLKCN